MATAAVLIVAGDQVPVMPGIFVELAGKIGAELFWHIGLMPVNVGVICGLILMSTEILAAHCPTLGVKV